MGRQGRRWDTPLLRARRKVGAALATGCAVVLKPSELTPLSAQAIAVLAQEAGAPQGAFNVVTGDAPPIGDVLTTDPRIARFTFTGSTPVGKALAARCMGTVKRVSLELGGNAPFVADGALTVMCFPSLVDLARSPAWRPLSANCGPWHRAHKWTCDFSPPALAWYNLVIAKHGTRVSTDEGA